MATKKKTENETAPKADPQVAALAQKMAAGLTREQALTVLATQAEHDKALNTIHPTNPAEA